MENVVVTPSKAIFYCSFVDDIYSYQKLGDNVWVDQLNNFHSNIKLAIEATLSTFLDTRLTNINGAYIFNIYQKNTKIPLPWTSKTAKRYKRNVTNDELHRSKIISSNFCEEIPLIKE